MLKYIIKRLALSVFILLGVSLIIYVLVRCMPVNYVEQKLSALSGNSSLDATAVEKMYEMYGLADDSFLGILKGYGGWLSSLCRFDFGKSFVYGDSVLNVIVDHMGVSFAVAIIATVFEFLIAIPLGITAATHQYSLRDYIVTIFVMVGISLPAFFFGQVLKNLLAMKLGWFPPSGLVDATQSLTGMALLGDYFKHMFIPILTVVILSIGGRMRMTRTNMLEVLNSDYIRTARAKGLSEKKVIYVHAFRNTMIPLMTLLAGILPSLFGGAMITEEVFAIDGIGRLAYKALQQGDVPFIMGYNMFLAVLTVIGTLLSDLMYAVVDPRVKLSK